MHQVQICLHIVQVLYPSKSFILSSYMAITTQHCCSDPTCLIYEENAILHLKNIKMLVECHNRLSSAKIKDGKRNTEKGSLVSPRKCSRSATIKIGRY